LHEKKTQPPIHPHHNILEEKKFEYEVLTIRKINKIIEQNDKNKIDDEALKCLTYIKNLEKQLNDIRNELTLFKKNELKRINREFLTNDYERRFKVNQETIISAIVGDDFVSSEYSRQVRDQKNYFKSIKLCKTFNFLETIGNKARNNNKVDTGVFGD